MLYKITIQRASGFVETLEKDLPCGREVPTALMAQIIEANRQAAHKDPSKGGEVLSVEYLTPVVDAETEAWEVVLNARSRLASAHEDYARRGEDEYDVGNDTARLGQAVKDAETALQQAMDDYADLPEHPHKLAEQREQAARRAELRQRAERHMWD